MDRSAVDVRPVRRPASSARLFAVYALVSLVPVVLLGIGLHRLVGQEVDDRALDEAVSRAETIADGAIEPVVGGTDLSGGITPAQRLALARSTAALGGDAAVLRLRIRTPTGTIVFDADHPEAAPLVDEDDEVAEAVEGGAVAGLTRVDADQVDASRGVDEGEQAVEAYVAFHGPKDTRVVGVLEVYLPYQPFQEAAQASSRRLTTALAVGLAALWGVLAVVSWSVTRRLRLTALDNDRLARHDPLTGLPNRLQLAEVLDRLGGSGAATWVAVVDVDRFGEVNAAIGPENADAVLRTFGQRLAEEVGPRGTVARLTGDRFGVAGPGTDPEADRHLLDAIDRATSHPVPVAGIALPVDVTVGVVHGPLGHGGAHEAIREADVAARAAKAAALPVLAYSPDLEEFDPDRLVLAGELGDAITSGQLELHYQPKLHLVTGEVRSVEALVRWRHPTRGLIGPASFIPVAESTSLIGPLTAWVLEEAAHQAGLWRDRSEPLRISVNVSARNLADPGLADHVLDVLGAAAVPPDRLGVEVTETAAIADPARARAVLGALRSAGVRISLDDFGQGATSLVSLADLPIDELKVDRAFVVGLEERASQRTVVEFVVALGHRLGLSVVAEGVETEGAARLLTSMGCDEGQGYLFCRPLPAPQLEDWLDRHRTMLLDVSRRSEADSGPVADPGPSSVGELDVPGT